MKAFIFLFCTTLFGFMPKHVLSQNDKIEIDEDKVVTVDEVFKIIRTQTDYIFVYRSNLFNNYPKITLKKGVIQLNTLLKKSLLSGNLNIIFTKNNTILIKEHVRNVKTLQRHVSGKVTEEKGLPLVGATIYVKGTSKGVVTDFNGGYSIVVSDSANILVFSSLGFEKQEITVGAQTSIDIVLKESVNQLDEVVINAGYYNTTQRKATGSIAKIDAKTIEKQPVNNPIAAMQGHMAGVNIRQTSGVPGSGFDIDIRGKNFINGGTSPLFIIDGVPYDSQSLELIGANINGSNISPLNAINPADIKSIEVLKDADATAIYGSRGANGVVLITTKKGKVGKTKLAVNVSATLGKVTRFMELLNTPQYLELRREGIINGGRGDRLDNPVFDSTYPDLKIWDQNRYTDWQEVLIGSTSYRNNAQLSLSGGSEQTQFLLSGGYQKETTVFPGDSDYKKGTLRSNISHQSKDHNFKINFTTSYTIEDNELPYFDFTFLANTLEPNAPALYDEAGGLNWENGTFENPLANSVERRYRAQSNTFITNTELSYRLHPNLELKANFGYTDYQLESYILFPSTALNPNRGFDSSVSSHAANISSRQTWITEPQLNWKKHWGHVNFNVLVGSTFQKQMTNQLAQLGTGFVTNLLIRNLAAAETIEVIDNNSSEYAYQAFFGRINVNYKDKYILNLTGRRDGSSRFAPDNQYGNFGAIGGAWLFSEEGFLRRNSIMSFGKLRCSYGTTGSDNIGNYKFLNTYDVTEFEYDGVTTLEPSGIFNPDYRWEENKKLEFALELGFLEDRVRLNTSWYQNRSSNQLIGIPLAATTGFGSLTGNFDATVENTGLEVDLRTTNIQNTHFKWTTTFNFTVPKNKLLKFKDIENSAFANRYRIGKPITEGRFFHALGVDPDTGLYQFEDYNNDGNISLLDDRQWFENLAPKYYGGFGNAVTYKGLSLEVFFQFKKQKNSNYLREFPRAGGRKNVPIQLLDRWQAPGDIKPVQIAGDFPAGNQSLSSAAISDASFIRLRNITLNYTIPKTWSYGMDINLYVQGQNLLTITNYEGADPEQPNNNILPPLQQITLGLQMGF